MIDDQVDWWNRYLTSDDSDHVVAQMNEEIKRLRAVLAKKPRYYLLSSEACHGLIEAADRASVQTITLGVWTKTGFEPVSGVPVRDLRNAVTGTERP